MRLVKKTGRIEKRLNEKVDAGAIIEYAAALGWASEAITFPAMT